VGLSDRRQNADIADTLHLRDVAMATVFGFLHCESKKTRHYNIVHKFAEC